MAAYVIVDLEITDSEAFDEYRKLVPALVEKYGGKYLARGGAFEVIEGSWDPTRLTVIEFESVDGAKQFFNAADYAPVKQIRLDSANSNVVVVEGV
jgi:uncharacterized protein (DUF1330 family)